jgi:hypothetical protein
MKVEAIHFSGTSVDFCQAITHYHIPVDNILLWEIFPFNIWYENIHILTYGTETWMWNKIACPSVGAHGIGC